MTSACPDLLWVFYIYISLNMLGSELIKLIIHLRAEEEGAYANADLAAATGLLRDTRPPIVFLYVRRLT